MTHSTSMGESTLPPLTPGPHRKRIGLISIVACLGGLLFGYDTGVSNGAEGPMQAELGLSDLQLGIVISSLWGPLLAHALDVLFGGSLLGLRALFVLVESLIERFRYLDETIAIVLGLVGERGREVRGFIDHDLGPEGLQRSVERRARQVARSPIIQRFNLRGWPHPMDVMPGEMIGLVGIGAQPL